MKKIRLILAGICIIASLSSVSQTILTGTISGGPFCPGASVSVPYKITGVFNSTNVFKAQLSNSAGSFASPTAIGSLTSALGGTIAATIPTGAAAGTGYRIRVISTSPSVIGSNNGDNLTILASANCGTSWSTTGNGGIKSNNFLGTFTDSPLIFRIANLKSGIIDKLNANTSIGFKSLSSNSGGFNNAALGYQALFSNTSGYSNAAVGMNALLTNGNGNFNSAFGAEALTYNKNGNHNSAGGYSALFSNVSGNGNTANGSYSLYSNSGSSYNTATGFRSLFNNTAGYDNIAVGADALFLNDSGYFNCALGAEALRNNTRGMNNTAVGRNALYSNTTANYNTALGASTLYSNSTGIQNTATGSSALYSNTTGFDNTATGFFSLNANTTGHSNVATGNAALYLNSTGYGNTANGYGSIGNNRTGYYNTAVGGYSLFSIEMGNFNTALGYGADVNNGALGNTTAIGSGAIANANNKVRLGNTGVSVVEGQVAYSFPSDGRFKTNVKENAPGLDLIMKLRPVTYNFQYNKFSEFLKEKNQDKDWLTQRESHKEMGLIAQDVEKTCKELGIEVSNLLHAPGNETDNYSLAYQNLVIPLVKGMQEQQKTIEDYKEALDDLQKKYESLESRLNALLPGGNNSSSPNSSLKMSPNPASGNTTLFLSNNRENVSIRITDEGGKLVWQSNTAANSIVIPCAKFTAGVYAVTVTGSKGTETTRLVVAK